MNFIFTIDLVKGQINKGFSKNKNNIILITNIYYDEVKTKIQKSL